MMNTLCGDILGAGQVARPVYITPAAALSRQPTPYAPSLWQMWAVCVGEAHGRLLPTAVTVAMDSAPAVIRRLIRTTFWLQGRVRASLSGFALSRVRELAAVQRRMFGPFNGDWVQHVDIRVYGALWDDGGTRVTPRRWSFCSSEHRLDELVGW